VPFTLSHVAAVVPGYRNLVRARLFSAAVIGSMVPDFGFLLWPGSLERWQTHSTAALFTFCLPVGLVVYCLLQWLIKPAVSQILPDRAYLRLLRAQPSLPIWSLQGAIYVAIAMLLGALTHLIWDGFTHESAHGVLMFPVLDAYGPDLEGHPVQFYRWLQYGSSILGLLVVIIALVCWWRDTPRPMSPPLRPVGPLERQLWSWLYVLIPTALTVWALFHVPRWMLPRWGLVVGTLAIAAMRGCALSLVLVSAMIRVRLFGARAVAD
jgi:hypothetical protein